MTYGVGAATGEVAAEGEALTEGGGAGGCASSARNALKSALLMTKAPSSSSVRATDVPSGDGPPMVSLCWALSSGEVVKLMTSDGLSNIPGGTFASQRTACSEASVFTSDCTLTLLIGPSPLTLCH